MRIILLAVGLLAVGLLAGCASDGGINQTGYSEEPLVGPDGNELTDASAKQVYRAAHEYLTNGAPEEALRLYANIDARYPFTQFADQAALETITAHYRARDFKAAIQSADQFLKQHPRSPHLAFVYYMRGLANVRANKDYFLGAPALQRSIDNLTRAFSDFRIVTQNYPNSDYAADARQHMIAIRNKVAKFNLRIASYYFDRQAYVAASRRASKIISRYQGSKAAPEALQIMVQSYAALDLAKLAADARAILQASYPAYLMQGSRFVETDDEQSDEASG